MERAPQRKPEFLVKVFQRMSQNVNFGFSSFKKSPEGAPTFTLVDFPRSPKSLKTCFCRIFCVVGEHFEKKHVKNAFLGCFDQEIAFFLSRALLENY